VYAIGGRRNICDSVAVLNSCERYSIAENKWEFIAPMNLKRCNATAVSKCDKLIVMGGYNGENVESTIESYDFDKKVWYLLGL